VILLPRWHGDIAAGIYGAAYNLWENLGLIPGSLLEAIFPEMAQRTRERKADSLKVFYQSARQILIVLIVVMVIGFILFTPAVFRILYGDMEGRLQSVLIFRWLLIGLPFTYLYLLDGNVLYALNRQRIVTRWMFLVTLLNVISNVILIPSWGIWAAMGVALFSSTALYWALNRETHRIFRSIESIK
jgi:O-antigen/teichoic acid export membrane protein